MAAESSTTTTIVELKEVCYQTVALTIVKANIHKPRVADLAVVDFNLRQLGVAPTLRRSLATYLDQLNSAVASWHQKHGALFGDRLRRRREHLRLYHDRIEWQRRTMCRDDLLTALAIVDDNDDWPQLQFQFACAYALTDHLSRVDKVSLRAFRVQLGAHPLYDFWIEYLSSGQSGRIFEKPGLIPKPLVTSAFLWALENDFVQLVQFFRTKISRSQFEYLSMKDWSRICRTPDNTTVFSYLCRELCQINLKNTSRITAQIFIECIHQIVDEQQHSNDYERLFGFFMQHACDKLKHELFHAGSYKALFMALDRNNSHVFQSLMQLVPPSQFISGFKKVNSRMTSTKLYEARYLTSRLYRYCGSESLLM